MSVDQMTSAIVTVTIFEMMAAIGLEMRLAQLTPVASNKALLVRAALANLLLAPALALAVALMFRSPPLIAVGLLLGAACPGGPYGGPFAGMAKGNMPIAVALSVILAAASAAFAPLILAVVVPMAAGNERVEVDTPKIVVTLVVTVLIPLVIGMVVRANWPDLADKLLGPAKRLSVLLNVVMVVSIFAAQFHLLTSIGAFGFVAMLVLAVANLACGWLVGGPTGEDRTTMAFTTTARNVGASLVIATASFPSSPALAAALAFALVQTVAISAIAAGWGRVLGAAGGARRRASYSGAPPRNGGTGHM